MIVSELQDRLWQLRFSDDKEDFWNWFKGNAEVILKRMTELETIKEDAENLQSEINIRNGEIDDLEERLSGYEYTTGQLESAIEYHKREKLQIEWEQNAWLS